MLDSNDRKRPVSVAARPPKTWDFMETTFVALVAYAVFDLTSWLTLVVLVATQDSAALSPTQFQALPRGWDSAASILGCASTIVVLWIAIGMARREFSEYLALNWSTRDEVMAALMITIILWLGEIVFSSPTASGVALGHFRWRSNSTWLAVIVHSGMNFFLFLTLRYA